MDRSCIKVQQKIKVSYITGKHWISIVVIVTVNGIKELYFYMLFTFFLFILGNLISSFFLFQNIYFSDNASLINTFIKNIIENIILQFLIAKLILFSTKVLCGFTADFTKIQTYFYEVLIILLYSKYTRNYESQKQPPEVFCKKRFLINFCKIHRKTSAPESLF